MEIMRKLFGMFLLLLIVSASLLIDYFVLLYLTIEEMVVPSEARLYESKSHVFKGACLSDHNCGMVSWAASVEASVTAASALGAVEWASFGPISLKIPCKIISSLETTWNCHN
ncbi:hypothetical protein QQP08_012545, partial [Theobroma cacao]